MYTAETISGNSECVCVEFETFGAFYAFYGCVCVIARPTTPKYNKKWEKLWNNTLDWENSIYEASGLLGTCFGRSSVTAFPTFRPPSLATPDHRLRVIILQAIGVPVNEILVLNPRMKLLVVSSRCRIP